MVELSDQERGRIETTVACLPPSVGSVLEVGVHDGRMAEALRQRVPRYVGLDLPRPGRGGQPFHQVFGTIAALPFSDRVFDMVVCCEVLEHLPKDVFGAALRELPRVASQSVLVTVPYRQKVECELTRCALCGFVGHWTSHVRSFSEDSLRTLLPAWELAELRPFGALVSGYAPQWLYPLKYRLGVFTQRPWACEACRRKAELPPPGLAGRVVQSLIWRLERRAPTRPAWLLARWGRPGVAA